MGVEKKDLVILTCLTIEQYLSELELLATKFPRTKFAHFLDSVAAATPQKALDEDLEEKEIPGAQAAAWSRGLRRLQRVLSDKGSLLVLVNQMRSKIGVLYGPTEETACGRAIKHYATLRIAMYMGRTVKEGERPIACWRKVVAFKNHVATSRLKADVMLTFDRGFDNDACTLAFAREVGAIGAKSEDLVEARKNLGWDDAGANGGGDGNKEESNAEASSSGS